MDLPPEPAAPSNAEPPRVSAIDRVQESGPPRARDTSISLSRWIRSLAVIGLLGLGVWGTFYWLGRGEPSEEADLLLRMSVVAPDFVPSMAMNDGDEASEWVFQEYGWPIVIPDLPDLQLVGAGETVLSEPEGRPRGAEASWVTPTFRYEGRGLERVVLYAYDYAQLDRASEWLQLPPGVYARLAEEVPFDIRRVDPTGSFAVTWRRRAVLFTAVTQSEEVVERLTDALSVSTRL